jgi:hypothetical protein
MEVPLYGIALGKTVSDYNNQMITLSKLPFCGLVNQYKFDPINQLISLIGV